MEAADELHLQLSSLQSKSASALDLDLTGKKAVCFKRGLISKKYPPLSQFCLFRRSSIRTKNTSVSDDTLRAV